MCASCSLPLHPKSVKSFAAQAKALSLTDLRELKLAKRRALLVCLLYRVQVKTRDHLVEMFLKRVQKMHSCAKDKLVELREQHLAQTESMLGVLAEILQTSAEESDTALLGERVQSVLTMHGGAAALLEQCEEITAYKARQLFAPGMKGIQSLPFSVVSISAGIGNPVHQSRYLLNGCFDCRFGA